MAKRSSTERNKKLPHLENENAGASTSFTVDTCPTSISDEDEEIITVTKYEIATTSRSKKSRLENPKSDPKLTDHLFRIIKDSSAAIVTVLVGERKAQQYKMLVVGETGSGKTSFLNLICNYNLVLTLGYEVGVEHFRSFNKIKFESNTRQMESKTNNATKYSIDISGWSVGIIDTPGFGDSRGIEMDKQNVKKIIDALKNEEYINCVCLVTNGRSPRMSATLNYVLSEITAILPKTVIDNVIVVFTNTTGMLHLTFDISELTAFFGRNIEQFFCIDNPYCLFEKVKKDPKGLTIDKIAQGLKDEFEKSAKVIKGMFDKIKDFQQVHTNEFIKLYQKKQEVELTVLTVLSEYNNQTKIEKAIAVEEEKLQAAERTKNLNVNFESQVELTKPVTTAHHNTLCGYPDCYSNCHERCSLPKSFDKETFLRCACINRSSAGVCKKCNHSYTYHYHNEVRFEKVTTPLIDEEAKAKYEEAKTAKETSEVTKAQLQRLKTESERKKKVLSEKLTAALEEFQGLGLNRNYLVLLENQLHVIEMYLETDEGNKEHLEKTKKELKKKIAIVRDSVKRNY
jgi:GTP-binding protein EngB required for normal cell division